MLVRPATHLDLPAILEIYNHAVLNTTATADYDPHTLAMRTLWFEERTAKGYPILVAEEDSEVIGWGALNPYHARIGYRFTCENSVYVAEAHRGQGAGKALLSALILSAGEKGLHTMLAYIDSENEASVRLHSGFGFQVAGVVREAYTKFNRWLNLSIMQLILDEVK